MKMIRAVVRSEKVNEVMGALMDAQFYGMTRFGVFGRGKQRGVKIGEVTYDELPKEMVMLVVQDRDEKPVVDIIMKAAKTGEKGAFGDGKIFVTPVDAVYTVSNGAKETEA